MGRELLQFPTFRKTISELNKALEALPEADRPGLDLIGK
jgi:hypothetical protein